MSKQRIKLTTNLINAEIYANSPQLVSGVKGNRTPSKYREVVEVRDDNGMHFETVERDYPITADYVNSFADAANYKKDISSALNAPKKTNLGDISSVQEILQSDSRDILQQIDDLKKRVLETQKEKEKSVEPAPAPTPAPAPAPAPAEK